MGVIKGDTRSSDYGSYEVLKFEGLWELRKLQEAKYSLNACFTRLRVGLESVVG